jgi:aspartyl-tRNA(Asn)/glutamyl-tRNA(Gln) amidotransferase subunit C
MVVSTPLFQGINRDGRGRRPRSARVAAAEQIDVTYVANLARLELPPERAALLQRQLETILAYVRQIGELDVAGIEPTCHGQAIANVFRADEPVAGLEREAALALAPARLDDTFKAPRIVE